MIPKTASGRWLAGITAVVVALVALSLVVAIATGSDEPPLLAEDTPEGTVQRYIQALQDADYAAAHALLTEDERESCLLEDYGRQRFEASDDVRVRLGETRPVGDNVEVTLHVTRFSASPPFGVSEYTQDYRYLLKETAGVWRIAEASWPFACNLRARPPSPTATPTPTPAPPPTPAEA
ncbi:MAG: hypothetical protein IIC31_09530 [Chloroflexi bacterium]|nr:hypothetical protein [Chloroflexota bacterium]